MASSSFTPEAARPVSGERGRLCGGLRFSSDYEAVRCAAVKPRRRRREETDSFDADTVNG
jgi:hypothetical protein